MVLGYVEKPEAQMGEESNAKKEQYGDRKDIPASVKKSTGIEGCLKESKRQISGLKEEKIIFRGRMEV